MNRAVPAALAAILALASCRSGAGDVRSDPAPGRTVADLERVFAPMREPLSVAADQVRIDVSRELFDRFSYPASSRIHVLRHDPGPPSTYRFRNARGGLDLPLRFVIGRQVWLVLRTAEIRVWGTGPARFDLEAAGSVVVSRPGHPPAEVAALRIGEGRWQERR